MKTIKKLDESIKEKNKPEKNIVTKKLDMIEEESLRFERKIFKFTILLSILFGGMMAVLFLIVNNINSSNDAFPIALLIPFIYFTICGIVSVFIGWVLYFKVKKWDDVQFYDNRKLLLTFAILLIPINFLLSVGTAITVFLLYKKVDYINSIKIKKYR